MGERKVLNRYIPPDFDPSLMPRIKRERNKTIEVRMMLPFSLQCAKCGEYMYRGKKFNSKMEHATGEDYLGIKRFRFYIKCCVCSNEITFKTDPKNTDYEMESGGVRNFELWRDTQAKEEEVEKEREEEDRTDSMKALENRTLDSKLEMDILDALDEIKAINQRHERVDTAAVLAKMHADTDESRNKSKLEQMASLSKKYEALFLDYQQNKKGKIDESNENDVNQDENEEIQPQLGTDNNNVDSLLKSDTFWKQVKASNDSQSNQTSSLTIIKKKKKKIDENPSKQVTIEAKVEESPKPTIVADSSDSPCNNCGNKSSELTTQVSNALSSLGDYSDSD